MSILSKFRKAVFTAALLSAAVPPAFADHSLSDVVFFPNPVRLDQGHDRVTLNGLHGEVRFQVFDALGRSVYERTLDGAAPYSLDWLLVNEKQEPLAPGIYYFVLTDPDGGRFKEKLAIIR